MRRFQLGNTPPQTLAIWAMAIGLIFLLLALPGGPRNQTKQVSYTEMIQYVKEISSDEENSAKLIISGDKWELHQKDDPLVIKTTGPITENLLELAQKQYPGLQLVIKPAEQPSAFWSLIIAILPFLFLGFLLWFFMRGMMKNQVTYAKVIIKTVLSISKLSPNMKEDVFLQTSLIQIKVAKSKLTLNQSIPTRL